ncbi:M15 family metallopeptidase [Aquibacillus halophilus]
MKFNKILPIIFLFIIIVVAFFIFDKYRTRTDVPMPTQLDPVIEIYQDRLIAQAATNGINILITDDFRSIEEQNALYARGRTTEGNIVTNVQGGESYHNYGLAIDFALQLENGDVIWDVYYDGNNNGESDWMEVVEIAKEMGFEWGGDWKNFRDYPHLQMDFGLTIWDLQRGKRPEDTIVYRNLIESGE